MAKCYICECQVPTDEVVTCERCGKKACSDCAAATFDGFQKCGICVKEDESRSLHAVDVAEVFCNIGDIENHDMILLCEGKILPLPRWMVLAVADGGRNDDSEVTCEFFSCVTEAKKSARDSGENGYAANVYDLDEDEIAPQFVTKISVSVVPYSKKGPL